MYISEIVMDGFKCYTDRTTIKNIDRNFTAITGMNGSGKSNIIDAIVFVFDLNTNRYMRVSSLKELLNIHRKECTVTITLHNSAVREAVHGKEKDTTEHNSSVYEREYIEISRMLNFEGKSKYKMNGNNCTKSTIESFCKSIGITNDFIVMQGHITKILNMKNVELKNMIEETAGTRNYANEREKSLELLQKKESKLREAQEHLKRTISPFFNKLKKEKAIYDENRDFQKNQREYLSELRKLEKINKKDDLYLKIRELKNFINVYTKDHLELKEIEEQASNINIDNGDVFDLKQQVDYEKNRIEEIESMGIQQALSSKQSDLKKLKGNADLDLKFNKMELMEKENILSKELLNGLNKIDELENNKKEYNRKINELNIIDQDISSLGLNGNILAQTTGVSHGIEFITDDMNGNSRKPTDDMNGSGRKAIGISHGIEFITNTIRNAQESSSKIKELEEQHSYLKSKITYPLIDGVYGTVDENFDFIDLKYKEAILTILGGRAKFIICKDDNVASEVLKMSDRKVSCIPLNKIVVNDRHSDTSKGGVDPLKIINYEKMYEKAFKHIFNGFCIFENKDEANKHCFEYKIICVTLDGTVYDPKGTLTGGKSYFKHDVIKMIDILRLTDQILNLKRSIPSSETLSKLKGLESLMNKKKGLENETRLLKSKIDLLTKLCYTNIKVDTKTNGIDSQVTQGMNGFDAKKELENTRQAIVEAAKEEKTRENINSAINALSKEVAELEANYEENQRNLHESTEKLSKLQESLRIAELNENNRRMSLRMIESLDVRKKGLIKSTVKLNSRIARLYEDILTCQNGEDAIENIDASANEMFTEMYEKTEQYTDDELGMDILDQFKIDEKLFKIENVCLKKETKSIIEDKMRILNEKISTKRTLNTMDPSSFEVLERNVIAIQTLENKIAKLENDKLEIIKSIEKLNEMGIKENRKAFEHINNTLRKFLSYFLNNSDIHITTEFEIKVKIGDWKNSLSELSGGQRSLIALCLIFSMLTFKSAPFYIFDEIDSALDLNYTQSIGEIIKREFNGAQFIVVSLKNNMFDNANKIFTVFIQDHRSKICQIK